MSRFFKRGESLEGELRAARPRPSDELVSRIEGHIRSERPALARRSSFRVAVPVALTAVMVGALAAVGGVGYAATSVEGAVKAVSHVFAPAKQHQAVVVEGLTSGGDQYKDGYGWGDDNHNHDGPPGVHGGKKEKQKGDFTPPLVAQLVGTTATVSTSFTIDEQAHLFISVIDKATGKQLLIAQDKSKVGKLLKGKQAKSLDYLVLVPRTIPLKLAIPANLLQAGRAYAIRVIARDPQGNKTNLLIPFNG
jgi:hypothetical protein